MENPADIITKYLDRPVVMIGLMGAGKTKMGGLLAQSLGVPFVDADQEIESAAGMSIADIFANHGESAFRDLERKILARLLSEDVKVIATGGGAVMNEQTAALVWEKSLSVWIKADLDVLVERTSRNNKRPLLKNGDPREILQNLMTARYPVYQQADVNIETNSADVELTLKNLLQEVAAHLTKDIK
jgi:shikimate kinase